MQATLLKAEAIIPNAQYVARGLDSIQRGRRELLPSVRRRAQQMRDLADQLLSELPDDQG